MGAPNSPSYHVVIVGAGIAGLSASIALTLKGHRVTVIERTSSLQNIGSILLIPPQVSRLLDSYGVFTRLVEKDTVRDGLDWLRYADGSVLGRSDFTWQKGVYGYPTLAAPRAEYQSVLYERALELGINIRLGCKIEDIDQSGPSLKLKGGEVVTADLIVGADGVRSKTRAVVLGKDIEPIRGDKSYLCRADGAAMRADPLTAPLMEAGTMRSWWGPGRHLVALPLRQANLYDMIVVFDEVYEGKPDTPLHTNWNSKGDVEHLKNAFADYEPRLRRALDYVPADECRLWNILSLPDLSTWVSPSGQVVILGDAAHAMRPYLAQGAAMAVEDGAVLAECLSWADTVDEISKAMKVYEAIRKPRAEKLKNASEENGVEKHLPDGEKQRQRDEHMKMVMNTLLKKVPAKGEKNMHPSHWIMGYDVVGQANIELGKVFGMREVSLEKIMNINDRKNIETLVG
ncbi:FAD/NAD(P)-binding domain-containing protein [Stipitochalara longipes BDJ]|nr:FAD/NAD(P)-binding domain-containing protein [Stipitochalara longipes BDJ]